MAIKADKESPVKCATCGQTAVRRVATVAFPGMGTANVAYDTHAESMSASDWLAAIRRLEKFFERAYLLKRELGALKDKPAGVASFDFETVHPDACSRRTLVVITALVKGFDRVEEVKCKPAVLARVKVPAILSEITPLVEAARLRLKRRFEEGEP